MSGAAAVALAEALFGLLALLCMLLRGGTVAIDRNVPYLLLLLAANDGVAGASIGRWTRIDRLNIVSSCTAVALRLTCDDGSRPGI